MKACVRCGNRPPSGETFLCSWCLGDDKVGRETLIARTKAPGYVDQRRVLRSEFGWVGGWPPIRESAR